MSTLILPAPTGELPDETVTLDVDALRKKTVRDLLDLAEKFDLRWPRDIKTSRFTGHDGNEAVSLTLHLDDDQPDAQAAWADALYLQPQPDMGLLTNEPYVAREASARGALAGFWRVTVLTFLHPARGLPEQGPRPRLYVCEDCGAGDHMGCAPVCAGCGDTLWRGETTTTADDGVLCAICAVARKQAERSTMTVRVADRRHSPVGHATIRTVAISVSCPTCGERRGKPRNHNFADDGEYLSCDMWDNPCGHVDMYDAVLREAEVLAAAEQPAVTS